MNAKILNFSISLRVLGRTMQAQLPSFTFMALYSRRLWLKEQHRFFSYLAVVATGITVQ